MATLFRQTRSVSNATGNGWRLMLLGNVRLLAQFFRAMRWGGKGHPKLSRAFVDRLMASLQGARPVLTIHPGPRIPSSSVE